MQGYVGDRAKRKKRNVYYFFFFIIIIIFSYYAVPNFISKEIPPSNTLFPTNEEINSTTEDIKIPILIVRNHKKFQKQSINLHANRSHAQYIVDLLIDGSENIDF